MEGSKKCPSCTSQTRAKPERAKPQIISLILNFLNVDTILLGGGKTGRPGRGKGGKASKSGDMNSLPPPLPSPKHRKTAFVLTVLHDKPPRKQPAKNNSPHSLTGEKPPKMSQLCRTRRVLRSSETTRVFVHVGCQTMANC